MTASAVAAVASPTVRNEDMLNLHAIAHRRKRRARVLLPERPTGPGAADRRILRKFKAVSASALHRPSADLLVVLDGTRVVCDGAHVLGHPVRLEAGQRTEAR